MSYSWDFGDGLGFTDNTFSPTHNYAAAGNYSLKLAATSSQGCTDTLITPVNISASGNLSDFTGDGPVCINTPVTFTNISSPPPNSSTWDYGDGTGNFPAETDRIHSQHPEYTMLRSKYFFGLYRYYNKGCKRSWPAHNEFYGDECQCLSAAVDNEFYRQLNRRSYSWLWNFGDGSPTSTAQNPQHVYSSYGTYQVILTASSAPGCSTVLTQNAFVNVVKPAVSIVNLPAYGCAPIRLRLRQP